MTQTVPRCPGSGHTWHLEGICPMSQSRLMGTVCFPRALETWRANSGELCVSFFPIFQQI